ncbi:hypothetical protein BRADI_1g59040v3 [Brachypodium distachyon]|uniref:Peptidase C1A papain C-terminal domain-containing protein n=1 Tax=Brachypodium distachyon TaxID=15368 RepID=I1H4A5_BRADI|nr:hypothetical protein BRADI_1g59040v3 [Brachypodium distachyon]
MAIAGCSTFAVGLWYMKNLHPSKIDWVEAGVVSPVVRNQNDCGSCWAMASVGSVEALHYMETKQSITLSTQELIDCDTGNYGCEVSSDDLQRYKGGIMDYTFDRSNYRRHYVLIVGYGKDSEGVEYWRFKNSWGEEWGEGGFGRIRRHVADKRGALGIYMLQEYTRCLRPDRSCMFGSIFVCKKLV